jgi:hypothetical protein
VQFFVIFPHPQQYSVLFKKNTTMKERASAALVSLQRNAYAMSMLRSRLESRADFLLKEDGGNNGAYMELSRVLELVKNGELILNEMSEKIESARFLEEFILIMDSAAESVSGIKDDIEQLVPVAEMALEEMQDAIAKVSVGIPAELRQEMEPEILAQVSAAIASENATAELATAGVEAKRQAPAPRAEKVEEQEEVAI